jgi:hypothetical protein
MDPSLYRLPAQILCHADVRHVSNDVAKNYPKAIDFASHAPHGQLAAGEKKAAEAARCYRGGTLNFIAIAGHRSDS